MRDRSTLICTVLFATVGRRRCCFAGWVDPDTPEEFHTTTANYHHDKREYDLVFSDEFEQDGRSFEDGADPRWTAIDKNDCEFVANTQHVNYPLRFVIDIFSSSQISIS